MFVSQERGAARKPFQKPNILRRKSKVLRLNSQKNNESSEIGSLSATSSDIRPTPSFTLVEQPRGECSQSFQIVQAPSFGVVDISEICDKNQVDTSQTLEIDGDSITIYAQNTQVGNNNTWTAQSTLNVESFLNDGAIKQNNILFNIDGTLSSKIVETDTKQKWCFDFMSEESKDPLTTNYYDGSQLTNIYTDKCLDMSTEAEVLNQTTSHDFINLPAQNIALESSNHMRAVKFKCDVPNCNKEFWTEARLQKHKNVHNKQKTKTPTILDCPVKKTDADGVETKCGRTFLIRNQLMKHLNEDHAPEDALFRCPLCGRRFFWAGGARLHQAGACARAFACAWAGCGRVFRHPCRLREHARAHTGDRPYPCHYPNCGWSFRSASKLVRHARRHTGERRHACGACGRAFLRREHLRDHAARHHAPHKAHPCTHDGCEETFPSVNSLYMHMKKVHKHNEGKPSAPKKASKRAKKDMFVVSPLDPQVLKIEADVEAIVAAAPCGQTAEDQTHTHAPHVTPHAAPHVSPHAAPHTEPHIVRHVAPQTALDAADGRCARTHCTWPLHREQHADYALEEAQVEQSESSESNIYTVRSDLFLHGNVLINEDSEFIISRAATGGEGASAAEGEEGGARGGAPLDALGLIDSHPTIDLMQEELMYADAVDESSFRVFLLNGEELA